MNTHTKRLLGALLAGLMLWSATAADEPAKTEYDSELVVVDGNGKENKLKPWKFTQGTRRLAWLSKDKPADAPEALEFRDDNSTSFAEGVVTLIPVNRLREMAYDYKGEQIKLTVAGPKADDKTTLVGETGFQGTVNKFTVASGEVKHEGGVDKGFNSLKFPALKFDAPPMTGRHATLTTIRSKKGFTEHKITDFRPLWRFADGSEILGTHVITKDYKADLAKLIKIERSGGENDAVVWIFTAKGADDETEPLLGTATIDGKEATLVGFVGQTPMGYKLFPPRIIKLVEFDVK
jgi:hypothetical protein